MVRRGLLLLTMLSGCVLSLPVTSSQLENEDVKVMKCIVEVLTDVLSRPHIMPVTQDCLVTLKTDDRLVKILRHHKFLKELQEIAVQGDHERAQLQGDVGMPTPMTQTTHTADIIADRSMLEALGGPGERSILSQEKRTGNGDGKEEDNEGLELQEDSEAEGVNRGNGQSPGSHASESVEKWNKAKAEKREEEEGEEASEEKRANSEDSEEGRFMKDEQGGESEEKRDAHQNKKDKKSDEEGDDEPDIKSALLSHKHTDREEGEQEVKRGSRESLKHWTKRAKSLSLKRKAAGKEEQQEVAHHSKEIVEEELGEEKRDIQRSPEEKELQMIARRPPEERRVLEEEGSASRKSEEPEIESLAAIESELENVAQKLHDLRRG